MIKYFFWLLSKLENYVDVRKFSFGPLFQVKWHSVTIDASGLHKVLNASGLIPNVSRAEVKANATQWFNKYLFSINDKVPNLFEFTNMLTTNSVSSVVSIHLERPHRETQGEMEVETMNNAQINCFANHHTRVAVNPGENNIVYAVET